ncbi:hypothetical protein [Thermogemmatispora carboxidivorans]|uniref:hypothetical protein n=1 Tax=Thermogemmatispora carboxidivorans TaxID=1382306 RepID=UPI00069A08F0|nr:hypothetical protein [Thermogemmatispora carboxidivorans]
MRSESTTDYGSQEPPNLSLHLAHPPETNLLCFRLEPAWLPPAAHDALNARVQAALLAQERIFLSLPLYQGKRWLRAVLLNPYTDEHIIERLTTGLARLLRQEHQQQDSSQAPGR